MKKWHDMIFNKREGNQGLSGVLWMTPPRPSHRDKLKQFLSTIDQPTYRNLWNCAMTLCIERKGHPENQYSKYDVSFLKEPHDSFYWDCLRAGLMNTLAAGDSYRDLVWWWWVPVGFNAQKRGSRPITAGAVHAHWFSPSSRERAAKRPFRVSLSFLLDVARFTVVIILALRTSIMGRRRVSTSEKKPCWQKEKRRERRSRRFPLRPLHAGVWACMQFLLVKAAAVPTAHWRMRCAPGWCCLLLH
jgi:hypothetical protein